MIPVKQKNLHDPENGIYGDSNNYAIAGHWGSGQNETMRWDPDDNKIILSGGPVSVAINDVIEVWVEHYL